MVGVIRATFADRNASVSMIIFTKKRKSGYYKGFITQNVHAASKSNPVPQLDMIYKRKESRISATL